MNPDITPLSVGDANCDSLLTIIVLMARRPHLPVTLSRALLASHTQENLERALTSNSFARLLKTVSRPPALWWHSRALPNLTHKTSAHTENCTPNTRRHDVRPLSFEVWIICSEGAQHSCAATCPNRTPHAPASFLTHLTCCTSSASAAPTASNSSS